MWKSFVGVTNSFTCYLCLFMSSTCFFFIVFKRFDTFWNYCGLKLFLYSPMNLMEFKYSTSLAFVVTNLRLLCNSCWICSKIKRFVASCDQYRIIRSLYTFTHSKHKTEYVLVWKRVFACHDFIDNYRKSISITEIWIFTIFPDFWYHKN